MLSGALKDLENAFKTDLLEQDNYNNQSHGQHSAKLEPLWWPRALTSSTLKASLLSFRFEVWLISPPVTASGFKKNSSLICTLSKFMIKTWTLMAEIPAAAAEDLFNGDQSSLGAFCIFFD